MTLRITILCLCLAQLSTAPAGLLAAQTGPAEYALEDPDEGQVTEVNILELTSIRYRQGRKLPAEVLELDGKRVRIEGYMSLGTLEGVQKFELVPEPCECGRSKVQHFIDVSLSEGQTTYIPGRITLEGVFSCGEVEEDGFVVSLYRLKVKSLRPRD